MDLAKNATGKHQLDRDFYCSEPLFSILKEAQHMRRPVLAKYANYRPPPLGRMHRQRPRGGGLSGEGQRE